MKVAYTTHFDAQDVHAWSGTAYNIAECLKGAGLELDYMGPLKRQYNPVNIARYLFNEKVLRKKDHPQRDPGYLRYYSKQVQEKLKATDAEILFGAGGMTLAHLDTDLPKVIWTDCTFQNLVDYYPAFSNLSARTLRNGNDAERRALAKCDLVLYSCQWAADSAINDYGVDPAKVHLVSFGSNMPGKRTPEDIEGFIAARLKTLNTKLTLFCSGVHWYRKGVDIAVKVTGLLNEAGIKTELLVAGTSPPEGETVPDYVRLLGFIKKKTPEGIAQLASLYETSHFFTLPTRADCTPIVFNEAAAYGLPSLAPLTGGCGSVIDDGVTGLLFDPSVSPQVWADRIAGIVRNPPAYAELCRRAFEDYRKRLNWPAAGQEVKRLLEELLAQKSGKPQLAAR